MDLVKNENFGWNVRPNRHGTSGSKLEMLQMELIKEIFKNYLCIQTIVNQTKV